MLVLRPGELQVAGPDGSLQTRLYADHPQLRAAVGQGLRRLAEVHARTVFGAVCGRCGNSCRREEILVREQEILRLQQHLGLSEDQFRRAYLRPAQATWNPGDAFLRLSEGACPFLEGDRPARCRIYELRPEACRSFRSQASFCRKSPDQLIERLVRVQIAAEETWLELDSGEVWPVPTDSGWREALEQAVAATAPSDSGRYATILEKALVILEGVEGQARWEGHQETLRGLEELLRGCADLIHLQPDLQATLAQGWTRLQALLERRPPQTEPPRPGREAPGARPPGLEWIHLVESGLTLGWAGGSPQVREFRDWPRLRELAWALLESLLSQPEEALQQALQEPEPACTMCGECCRLFAVEISPSELERLAGYLGQSTQEFRERWTVEGRFGWNPGNRILRKQEGPVWSKRLRELTVVGEGRRCVFLERQENGFLTCGVYPVRPQPCVEFQPTSSLCRRTNQAPNPGRQAHSLHWLHLGPEALTFQTARGLRGNCQPVWVSREAWPEVEEAALALERAAAALGNR